MTATPKGEQHESVIRAYYAYRSEVDELIRQIGMRMYKSYKNVNTFTLDVPRYLVVGPEGSGKSSMMRLMLEGDFFKKLAEEFWLNYTGVYINARSYVKNDVLLPQERVLDALMFPVKLIIGMAGRVADVDYITEDVELTWNSFSNFLREKVLGRWFANKPTAVFVVLDNIDTLPARLTASILDRFISQTDAVARNYGVKVVAIATMRPETLISLRRQTLRMWDSEFEVRYMLGFSAREVMNILFRIIENDWKWNEVDLGSYDIWHLTGGLPPALKKLRTLIERSESFDRERAVRLVADTEPVATVLYKAWKASVLDALREVAHNPDLLGEPEYLPLRRLLTKHGLVVHFEDESHLLTERSSPKYIGRHYAWVIPAQADYTYDFAERHTVGLEPKRVGGAGLRV